MRKLFLTAFLVPLLGGAAILPTSAVAAPSAGVLVAPEAAPLLLEAQYYHRGPPPRAYRRGPPPRRYHHGRPYTQRYNGPPPRYGYR